MSVQPDDTGRLPGCLCGLTGPASKPFIVDVDVDCPHHGAPRRGVDDANRGWWENPDEHERVEVTAYPEEWYHLHGKAMSGLRHSHPMRDGEDPDKPWHIHEGEYTLPHDSQVDRRGVGAALYPRRA